MKAFFKNKKNLLVLFYSFLIILLIIFLYLDFRNKSINENSKYEIIESEISLSTNDQMSIDANKYKSDINLDNIVWKSSNENIVSVDGSGVVTAISSGTAEISINEKDKKIVVIKINVSNELEEKIEPKITLLNSTLNLSIEDSYSVEAEITPSNFSQKIKCSVNDNTIASENNCTIKAIKQGQTIVNVCSIENSKLCSEIIVNVYEKTIDAKTYKLTYDCNNGTSQKLEDSCITSESSCSVKLKSGCSYTGYEFVGWSEKKNNTTYKTVDTSVSLSENKTLYALWKKPEKKYTISFFKNGATSISKNQVSCTIPEAFAGSKQSTTCSITLPTITIDKKYSTVIGWSKDRNSTTSEYAPGTTIKISSDMQLYAITKSQNPYTATFNKGYGASVSSNSISCYRYNNSKSCSIVSPKLIPNTGGTSLGWSTSASKISGFININSKITLTKNVSYYGIAFNLDNFTLYMNTSGNDSNIGIYTGKSLKSLLGVYNRLVELSKIAQFNKITIKVGAGTYSESRINWISKQINANIINLTGSTGITPTIFSGKDVKNNLSLLYIRNDDSKIVYNISNLTIDKYANGIFGYYINKSSFNNLKFTNIGVTYSKYTNAYGGIDIQYSSNNTITNCTFTNFIGTSGRLHGIYIANSSNYNKIYNNTFKNCDGDPIRVRNVSNYNEVYNNTFTNAGKLAYMSEWYRNYDYEPVDGEIDESASTGNKFYNNKLNCGYNNTKLKQITCIATYVSQKTNGICIDGSMNELTEYDNTNNCK